MKTLFISWLLIFLSNSVFAIEQNFHGIIDAGFSSTDGVDSYLDGSYGKFRLSDGEQFSLLQAGLVYVADWQNKVSLNLVGNGYVDGVEDGVGITEGFLKYKGLPSADGYRFESRVGFLYPKVSFENISTAWSSPYTNNYSAINSWVGEELRHQGIDISITRLGKFNNSEHDFEFGLAIYRKNDTAGAVISWHGWVLSSRQSFRQDNLPLPNASLPFVPQESDAFREVDDKLGYHSTFQWTWLNKAKLLVGYYNNRGIPYAVEELQYAWETRFSHIALKWNLSSDTELIIQHLAGNTLMQKSPLGDVDVVKNDYDSNFILLSKRWKQLHRFSGRLEHFSVDDLDDIAGDDNNETGKAATINYTYRLDRQWFLSSEYSWIQSDRASRAGRGISSAIIERQLLLSARYYF